MTAQGENDEFGQDLLRDAHALFAREPSIVSILSIDQAELKTQAGLFATILSGAAPDRISRQTVATAAKDVFAADQAALDAGLADVAATARKNFEPGGAITTLLFSRGIHALLAHRVTHSLWISGRRDLSLALKTVFGRAFSTDIHPAARLGSGLWLDHGLGFVVGETAVIGDDVSIWHGVTLGSTLKDNSDRRHPRIGRGVIIGADAVVLGGIEVGEGSVIAAGAVVTSDVAPNTTVAGVPARAKTRTSSSFNGF